MRLTMGFIPIELPHFLSTHPLAITSVSCTYIPFRFLLTSLFIFSIAKERTQKCSAR